MGAVGCNFFGVAIVAAFLRTGIGLLTCILAVCFLCQGCHIAMHVVHIGLSSAVNDHLTAGALVSLHISTGSAFHQVVTVIHILISMGQGAVLGNLLILATGAVVPQHGRHLAGSSSGLLFVQDPAVAQSGQFIGAILALACIYASLLANQLVALAGNGQNYSIGVGILFIIEGNLGSVLHLTGGNTSCLCSHRGYFQAFINTQNVLLAAAAAEGEGSRAITFSCIPCPEGIIVIVDQALQRIGFCTHTFFTEGCIQQVQGVCLRNLSIRGEVEILGHRITVGIQISQHRIVKYVQGIGFADSTVAVDVAMVIANRVLDVSFRCKGSGDTQRCQHQQRNQQGQKTHMLSFHHSSSFPYDMPRKIKNCLFFYYFGV